MTGRSSIPAFHRELFAYQRIGPKLRTIEKTKSFGNPLFNPGTHEKERHHRKGRQQMVAPDDNIELGHSGLPACLQPIPIPVLAMVLVRRARRCPTGRKGQSGCLGHVGAYGINGYVVAGPIARPSNYFPLTLNVIPRLVKMVLFEASRMLRFLKELSWEAPVESLSAIRTR